MPAYLDGLSTGERNALLRANRTGVMRLQDALTDGEPVAFLGAGASAPLYPLWSGVIEEPVEIASDRLSEPEVTTCRTLAARNPDALLT